MIQLQERDRKLIRLCYEQTFIVTDHAEKFFGAMSYRACRRRVQKLVTANYLQEELTETLGKKPLYRVSNLGRAVALESGSSAIVQPHKLQLVTLVHDSIVTSVRLRLEELWNGRFICERAIKGKEFKEIPDGLFVFGSGKTIALEIENSDKGRTRFIRLLKRWKDVPQISFVLYVATTRELFEIIKRHLPHGPEERPMGVVLWAELAKGQPLVWTRRGDVRLFDRREL